MKSLISKLIRAIFLTTLVTGSWAAANDTPPPPDEVFRYAIFDAGDALEIDWAVSDGAYMYRDAFDFESGNPAVVLGAAEMPEGKVHSDEFLGEQTVYRGSFFIRIPYTVAGDRPDSLMLTIKSRGCLDSGFCYVPQTWVETVALEKPKAAGRKLDLGALGGSSQSEFPPPDEVFFPDLYAVDGNTVEVGFRIIPGYYLYKNKISARVIGDNARAGSLELPAGTMHSDEFFGEQEVYYTEAIARLSIARATPEPTELTIEVNYQGCADDGLCYLPQTKLLTVSLPEAESVTDLSATAPAQDTAVSGNDQPQSEQSMLANIILNGSLWTIVAAFFASGLALAFTPCVLPMIPILSGIIAGDGDNVSPLRGFSLALSYVLGMAIVYTAAGIAAAALGLQLQAAFNQPWVLILFAGLFVVLAISMFGVFDLQMPSSIQSKLAGASSNQKSGTVIGAFIMGAISALVVTACVAPALIAGLTVIAQTGDMLRGGVALFALSMGMGAPLLLVGAAQGQLLPKAGGWMIAVKGAFGFLMLALAVWMLSRILPGTVTMILWATLILMSGVFLGGLTTLGTDANVPQKLGKGFGLLAIFYGLILFLGAMTGGTNPLKPLASVNLGSAGGAAQQAHLEFTRIKTVEDLDREIAAAAASGKTAMLDFYADWCVSCIEMEEYTFITPEVQAALANTVTLQADVTRNDAEDKRLLERFGVFGPPTIIFFGPDGIQRQGYEVVGFMNAEKFAAHVNKAFSTS